jgi:ribosomal protein S18 acetylase RimI-like enzyme
MARLAGEKLMEKVRQHTLIARVEDVLRSERRFPPGYHLRCATGQDRTGLADLYFAAYSRDIVQDHAAAVDEIEETFRGEYGQLDLMASPVLVSLDVIAGAVLTVEEAPWQDTPPGPFIIEVMVHPDHRRLGLAECMMKATAERLAARGKQTMALRVLSDNVKALALYKNLGFDTWEGIYSPA